MGTTRMKHVKYTGDDRSFKVGATALMDDNGRVQLDGPKDFWRTGSEARKLHPLCFGWHDCGTDWVDVEQEVVWEPPK